jgi:curved DNA-binding protein CbpA
LFLRRKLRRVTDYFAFFDQPRRPWIDLEKLEEKYRELARSTHPDQSAQPSNDFAQVNEGYRLLRDPKSRLQHLLALEGHPPSASTAEIPADLSDLFMKIAPALARNDEEEIRRVQKDLNDHSDDAVERLRQLDRAWDNEVALSFSGTENLYIRFAFLQRWRGLLDERSLANSFTSR